MRRIFLGCGLAAVLWLTGCATVQTIPVAYEPEVSRASVGRHDYDTAVKAIAAVMVEDLGLPNLDATVNLYSGREKYRATLGREVHDLAGGASAKSEAFARASCGRHTVLADRGRLAAFSWRARVRTVAHEMVHLAEFALADWNCAEPHYWLMEGFAQWGAYKIVASLGLQSFAESLALFREDVARAYHREALPALGQLASAADWDAAERATGRETPYGGSVFAVDFLIERKGLAAVIDYFARFKDSASRGDNFSAAFGEDVETFETDFEAHLKTLFM